MKSLATCLVFVVALLGCDASAPDVTETAPVQVAATDATFPFGLTLTSTGSGSEVASRRKVCFIEIGGTGGTQCVVNRSTAQGASSWDGGSAVQQIGLASGAPLDVLTSFGGYSNVVNFEVGSAYQIEICGAGNTFEFRYLRRSAPDLDGGEVPGLHFSYVDGGLPGRPAQFGVGGQLELESQSSASLADVTPILLFVPISSGPACEF